MILVFFTWISRALNSCRCKRRVAIVSRASSDLTGESTFRKKKIIVTAKLQILVHESPQFANINADCFAMSIGKERCILNCGLGPHTAESNNSARSSEEQQADCDRDHVLRAPVNRPCRRVHLLKYELITTNS